MNGQATLPTGQRPFKYPFRFLEDARRFPSLLTTAVTGAGLATVAVTGALAGGIATAPAASACDSYAAAVAAARAHPPISSDAPFDPALGC